MGWNGMGCFRLTGIAGECRVSDAHIVLGFKAGRPGGSTEADLGCRLGGSEVKHVTYSTEEAEFDFIEPRHFHEENELL